MMKTYSTEITLRQITIDAISQSLDECTSLFEEDVKNSKDDLLYVLDQYVKHIDPLGRVYEFTIDSDSVEIDQEGSGSFQVEFTVSSYSGCKDIDNDTDQEMDISVEVNFETSIAELTGDEVPPDRDPDEY